MLARAEETEEAVWSSNFRNLAMASTILYARKRFDQAKDYRLKRKKNSNIWLITWFPDLVIQSSAKRL